MSTFIKKETPAQIFSSEFCEISHNTSFVELFGQLFLHNLLSCLLSHHNLSSFQKRCHAYFLAEHFLTLHKKWNFFIKDFFSKYDQIRSFLLIWSHLLKKSLIENFILWSVSLIWRLGTRVSSVLQPLISHHGSKKIRN